MSNLQIPQGALLINGFAPQVNTGALLGDWISCKTVHKAFVVFHVAQGHATQPVLRVYKATNVAGDGGVVITTVVPIWYNLDCDSDGMTQATDAVNYTLDVGLATKLVIFQVDPSTLGAFDCIKGYADASDTLNVIGCTYILENRYKGVGPPSVIID